MARTVISCAYNLGKSPLPPFPVAESFSGGNWDLCVNKGCVCLDSCFVKQLDFVLETVRLIKYLGGASFASVGRQVGFFQRHLIKGQLFCKFSGARVIGILF